MNNNTPSSPLLVSGTEDRRSNILTKDVPIALIAQEVPRIWRSVSQEPGMMTKYIFLIITHNITN